MIKTYDSSNKKDPIRFLAAFTKEFELDVAQKKTMKTHFKKNEIWDDDKDFGEPSLRVSFVDDTGDHVYDNKRRDSN